MSRTRRDPHKDDPGREWWGKRPFAGHPVSHRPHTNKWWKRKLHKKERRLAQQDIDSRRRASTESYNRWPYYR